MLEKMAFKLSVIALVAFLLLQPLSASTDFLSPLLSPIFDDVCKHVECGKGTCKTSTNSTIPFECECDQGWMQALGSTGDSGLKFLPCIIPNCTMNSSCSKAPAPAPEQARQANETIFNACHWVDCGGGSCNKTSIFSYSCQCDAGFFNLLNVTSFPCYKECAIGMGCSDLGISGSNKSSTTTPPTALDSENEGSSILQGSSLWLVLLTMVMAMVQLQ